MLHASGFVNEGNNFNHDGVDADAAADPDGDGDGSDGDGTLQFLLHCETVGSRRGGCMWLPCGAASVPCCNCFLNM